MHLTAESTSQESSSLVTQTASRLPDREIKTGERDTTQTREWQRRDKERKWRRWTEEGTVTATPCSAHPLIWQTANIISHHFLCWPLEVTMSQPCICMSSSPSFHPTICSLRVRTHYDTVNIFHSSRRAGTTCPPPVLTDTPQHHRQ